MVLDDIEIAEKAREMIDKYGHASLGVFAYSLSMPEESLRRRLIRLGFNEHKRNRFIYGDNFKMPAKPEEDKPEIKRLKEEREGWVV